MPTSLRAMLTSLFRFAISMMVVFTYLLIALRLVMAPWFLHFEYQRVTFPQDTYGFTEQDRLEFAPIALEYLLNNRDESFLQSPTLVGEKCFPPQPTPCALFNTREIAHMVDVKNVTQMVFIVSTLSAICVLITFTFFWWRKQPSEVRVILMQASVIIWCVVPLIAFFAVFAWDTFFDNFHALFFTEGTWQFFYSDTLIRLFPEQFWLDSALLVGFLTLLMSSVMYLVVWRVKLNRH